MATESYRDTSLLSKAITFEDKIYKKDKKNYRWVGKTGGK